MKSLRRAVERVLPLFILLALLAGGCGGEEAPLILAATNDLEGSGILEAWAAGFGAKSGRRVELAVVPDGEALDMARYGECDIMLTHIPEEEARLVKTGRIEGGREVMRGDYVLLGPPQDPAGIKGGKSAAGAVKGIADSGQTFVLRIDGSGTAAMQATLLVMADVDMAGEWLLPTEAGAEGALREASREKAYTLAGRSVYRRLAGELELEMMCEGDEALVDHYSAAAVSVFVFPDTDLDGALDFIAYLLTSHARSLLDPGAWSFPGEQ